MSRIGKKPIPMPAGVKYTVSEDGNTVLGPLRIVSRSHLANRQPTAC